MKLNILTNQLEEDLNDFKNFIFEGRDIPLMISMLDKTNQLRLENPSKSTSTYENIPNLNSQSDNIDLLISQQHASI